MPIAIKMAGKEIASYDTTTDKVAIKLGDDVSINDSAGNVVLGNSGLTSNVVFPTGVVIGMAFLADVTDGNGGTPSNSAAVLRTLNTTVFSINCPTTIASNEFSFDEAGTYVINASAPVYQGNRHILQLSDDSGSTFIGVGSAEYNDTADYLVTRSFLCKNVTVSSSQITNGGSQRDFGLYHIVDSVQGPQGLGVDSNDTTFEQYLQVQIFRLA